MSTRELLVEIGCEELPADWLGDLVDRFGASLGHFLEKARIEVSGEVRAFGTPRRLVAHGTAVAARQEDRYETLVGPPARVGRNESGWTRAAEGFARKHGIGPADLDRALTLIWTKRGEYVAIRRRSRGKTALAVLPGVLEKTLRSLHFPKAMHWDARISGEPFLFGRPIRWIVALFGDEVIPFEIAVDGGEPVISSNRSRGHRFRARRGGAGTPFAVDSFAALREGLHARYVMLDRDARAARLRELLLTRERQVGASRAGSLRLDQLADLVEWPGTVLGRYPDSFLALPEEIRHTVLVHHQKYIPLADAPAFVAVTNMPDDPEGHIRRGSERVVRARLRDARFFWDQDRKTALRDRRADLAGVRFHEKLGSFAEKAERLESLAGWIADEVGADPEAARQAAGLAKCDLTTGLVGEFASLQGIAGGLLLREEGAPEAVWRAVYDHYRPGGLRGRLPRTVTGAIVSLADSADTLASLTLARESVSGAGDPFGLRRAAFSVIRILDAGPALRGGSRRDPWPTPAALFERVRETYGADVSRQSWQDTWLALLDFFEDRLRSAFERDFPRDADAVRVVLARGGFPAPTRRSVADVRRRIRAIATLKGHDDLLALAAAANRVGRILPPDQTAADPDPELFTADAEGALFAQLREAEERVTADFGRGRYLAGLSVLSRLRPIVDRFFDDVLVMVENPQVRANRLALLARLHRLFSAIGVLRELDPARTRKRGAPAD